jgi:hypothetical protein
LIDAQVPYGTPFVLVRYAIGGLEQAHSLRLDLDKRVFLDRFEDLVLEGRLQASASQVVDVIRKTLMQLAAAIA